MIPMGQRRVIFLIHGVGNPKEGDARSAVLTYPGDLGVQESDVFEINWNSLVPGARDGRKIDHNWLSSLARSILASAEIGFSTGVQHGVPSRLARLQHFMATVLKVVASFAPVLLVWGLLCLLFGVVRADVGTPWVAYRFEPAAYLGWWQWSSFLTYPLHVGKWPAAWKVTVLGWAMVVAVLALSLYGLGLPDRSPGARVASLRRAVLTVVGPIVYALGLPFVWKYTSSIGLLAYLVLATLIGVPDYEHEIVSATAVRLHANVSFSSYVRWGAFGEVLVVILALLAAAAVILMLAAPALKVLADIFRYIGDTEYRRLIHEGVRSKVREAVGEVEDLDVVLAGHSLGSVIALDALRARPSPFEGAASIHLVTGGSPLRRLFHRFFRGSYRRPDIEARRLQSQYNSLVWMNVFRPLDYIGGRLGDRQADSIRDIRLPQRHQLHIGYWSDCYAIREIANAMRLPGQTKGTANEYTEREVNAAGPPTAWDENLGQHAGLRSFWHAAFPLGLGLLTAFNYAITEPAMHRSQFEGQRSELRERGMPATANIYRVERDVWEGSGEWEYVGTKVEYWIRFPVEELEEPQLSRLNLRFHAAQAIDSALAARQEIDQSLPATLAEVGVSTSVRYLPGRPDRVHAPEFYVTRWFSWWRSVGAIFQAMLGALYALIPIAMYDGLLGGT